MGHHSFWSCEGVLQSETLLPMDSFSHRTWPGRPLQGTTLLSPSCCCCSLSLRCKFRKCTTETCMFVKKNCLLFLCGLTGFTNVPLIMQPWVVWWQINHINKPSWTLKSVHRQTETETPDTVLQTAAVVVPTSERHNCGISIFCYLVLPLHYILEDNIVLFTALHLDRNLMFAPN